MFCSSSFYFFVSQCPDSGHSFNCIQSNKIFEQDAVAIEAARQNIPEAFSIVCDGWGAAVSESFDTDAPAGEEKLKKRSRSKTARQARVVNSLPMGFDLIVSNPPVHAGQPDCLTVVVALVTGMSLSLPSIQKHDVCFVTSPPIPKCRSDSIQVLQSSLPKRRSNFLT